MVERQPSTNAKTDIKSTVERWRLDPAFAQEADQEYRALILSELLLALDNKLVRQLAKKEGLPPTAIQEIRFGNFRDMSLRNFIDIVQIRL